MRLQRYPHSDLQSVLIAFIDDELTSTQPEKAFLLTCCAKANWEPYWSDLNDVMKMTSVGNKGRREKVSWSSLLRRGE
jgi:hypothetical protein